MASDVQFRAMPPLDNKSQSRPDIIVFDTTYAFTPTVGMPFQSVVIIEFKKPMRDDYTHDKNPFSQICRYIEEIRSSKGVTHDGHPTGDLEQAPFYCYVVCTITPTLEDEAKYFGLTKTPDRQGYFGYQDQYSAYFEVISYDKMVGDAKKRNAVLFDKLGLSPSG